MKFYDFIGLTPKTLDTKAPTPVITSPLPATTKLPGQYKSIFHVLLNE